MIKIKNLKISFLVAQDTTDTIPSEVEIDYELFDDENGMACRKVNRKETKEFDLNVPVTDFWNQILNSINA